MMLKRLLVGIFLAATLSLVASCKSAEERAEQHFQAGQHYVEAGDIDRALVEFRNVFKLNGHHEQARLIYARLQRQRGALSEAYGQYLRLVEQDPGNFEAQLALAEMAIGFGNRDEAEKHGRIAARLDPEDPESRAVVAVLDYFKAVQADDTKAQAAAVDTARALLAGSDEKAPQTLLSYQIVIDHLIRTEDWPAARAALDKVVALYPSRQDLQTTRLGVLNELGDKTALEAALRDMVARFPDDDAIRTTLTNWYLSENRPDAAEAFLRSQIDPAADTPDREEDLIRFLNQVRGPKAAGAELDRILATNPAHDITYRALRAGLAFDAGQTETAIAGMEALLKGAKPSAEINKARIALAHMLIATGNPVGARAQVEEVLANDSTNSEAVKLKAGWLIEDDQTDAAIVLLRSALGESPRDAELMTLLARAHERNGDLDLMADMLALAVEASGSAPEESLRYAAYLARTNRQTAAEGVLLDALRLQPDNTRLLNALGTLYVGLENWGRVRGVVERLRSLPDGPALADELTARMLNGQGRQEALLAFLRGLAEKDGDTGVRISLIRSLIARDDIPGALNYVESALHDTPDDIALQTVHGTVLALAGHYDEAEAAYRALLARAPDTERAWLALYQLKQIRKDDEGAAQVLDAALKALPDSPDLLWARATALQNGGDTAGAMAIYEKLYADHSDNLVIANNLASLLSDHGTKPEDLDRAWRIARRLRESANPAFRDTYGWITFRRGNPQEALSYLTDAAAALPDDPFAQYHLGAVYAALGRAAEALVQFRKVQSLPGAEALAETVKSEIARLSAAGLKKGDATTTVQN